MAEANTVLAREWLEKAAEDYAAAKLLRVGGLPLPALFHCQQAVEKALKACLLLQCRDLPKSHDIAWLLRLVGEEDGDWLQEFMDDDPLTQYAVEMRYPGAGGEVGSVSKEHFSYSETLLRAIRGHLPSVLQDTLPLDET